MSFLEEMWSRNLGHLFVSPLRPYEMLVSLMVVSLVRTLIGLIPASLLALMFFGFSLYSLGVPLIGFFLNLIVMGWSMGFMVSGLVLRVGLGAESLVWAAIFAVAPLCGIYYPHLGVARLAAVCCVLPARESRIRRNAGDPRRRCLPIRP